MNAAVIKVAFANPPKPGGKQATIKTDDGAIYFVWPDKFGLFQPGRSYRVEFSTRPYQGKDLHTITKCEPVADLPSATGAAGTRDDEGNFVARVLAASISACAVGHSEAELIAEVRMLRSVYRKSAQ